MRFWRILALMTALVAALALPASVATHTFTMARAALAPAPVADSDCIHDDHHTHEAPAQPSSCCHVAGFAALPMPMGGSAIAPLPRASFVAPLSEQLSAFETAPPVPPPRASA